MKCPDALELCSWVDEGRPPGAALEQHLTTCPACIAALEKLQLVAASLRGLPSHIEEAPNFLRQVNARVQRAPRARWALPLAASLATVVFVLVGARLFQSSETEFTPRGSASDAGASFWVDFFTQREPGGAHHRLVAGERVSSSSGFTFAVQASRPTELMLFGVDAKQNVHWFYPAFIDAGSDPTSISSVGSRALPEAVVPDDAASGPFALFGLFSKTPLHVSEVEAMLRDGGIDSRSTFTVHRLDLQIE